MPGRFEKVLRGVLTLVTGTVWAFAAVRANDFIRLDDPAHVTGNDVVRGGLSLAGLRWAFTSDDVRLADVLGAARAETGDFEAAVEAARRATPLHRAQDRPQRASEVETRLGFYLSHAPFHRPPPER